MTITITEALAEIKTIGKRITKKREAAMVYLSRQDGLRDPLAAHGGSAEFILKERQSIADLEARILALRNGIRHANDATTVVINGMSATISDWIVWRRDVAPGLQQFLVTVRSKLNQVRENAKRQGFGLAPPGSQPEKPTDYVINVDEGAYLAEAEKLEDTLGQLDGQLSLKNATVTFEL